MLRFSRREEDFDNFSMFDKFLNDTSIGRLLRKYNIFSKEDLRDVCLTVLSGATHSSLIPLSPGEISVILYAIETGAITYKEYFDTYEGKVDTFNRRFIEPYKEHKELIDNIVKGKIDITDDEIEDITGFLGSMEYVLDEYGISHDIEDVTEFCSDIIYANLDDPNKQFFWKGLYDITIGDFVVLCIEKGLVDIYGLSPQDPVSSVYFIRFVDLESDYRTREFLKDVGEKIGVYDTFFQNKTQIINKIIEDEDSYMAHLIVDELDLLNYEDLKDFYRMALVKLDLAKVSHYFYDLLELLRRHLRQWDIDEINYEVFGPYEYEDEEEEL
ncbi:MAG: hypothetical protein ACTSQY_11070 [Candidatus Odinarchaeia archaeon]